jgi:hypothetical protein
MDLAQFIAARIASLRATEDEEEDEASSGPFIPRQDCYFWLKGHCRFGQNCTYKHDPEKKGTWDASKGTPRGLERDLAPL